MVTKMPIQTPPKSKFGFRPVYRYENCCNRIDHRPSLLQCPLTHAPGRWFPLALAVKYCLISQYYGVATCANLHWCSHFKMVQDLHVPATSWPQKIFRRYIGMCRYKIKGKKTGSFRIYNYYAESKKGVVKLPAFKCPDLVDLACISNIRVKKVLELTFRVFHVHFEVMVCA
jgi:hypothetical protein